METIAREEAPITPWVAALIATLSLVWGFAWFTVSGHDDCHITYWASYTLSHFGEIANYSGARVEQSSSLLHTILLAFLDRATPWSIPTLGFFVGLACAWLCVFRMARLKTESGVGHHPLLLISIAISGPWLYWAMGGLETTLVALVLLEFTILVIGIHRHQRRPFEPAAIVIMIAATWVRPEGFFVVASALLGIMAARRALGMGGTSRPWLSLLLVATICFLATTAWRHSYFDGSLFPQPVQVKFDGRVGTRELGEGFLYLKEALMRPDIGLAALLALAGGAIAAKRGLRPCFETLSVGLIAGAYLAFIATVGGDWMEASRFIAHVWPLLALLLVQAVSHLPSWWATRVGIALSLAGVISVALIAGRESAGRTLPKFLQVDHILVQESGDEFSWTERARLGNARDVLFFAKIDSTLASLSQNREGESKLRVLSGQAGMLMYHLARKHYGRFEFIDRFALSSTHLIPLIDPCGLPGGHYGLRLTTETYFRCIEQEQRADLVPDVIFDIRTHHMKSAKKRRMRVLHHQFGDIVSWREPGEANWLFRVSVPAFEFVAVREELAPVVKPPLRPKKFNWNKRRLTELEKLAGG